jgi:hypothetical protein
MVIRVCELTGYGQLRYVWVSLPYVPALLDGEKYLMPDATPEPETRDLRKLRRRRSPPLKALVRLALECESAEELGFAIRRRYERQQRRARQAEAAQLSRDP